MIVGHNTGVGDGVGLAVVGDTDGANVGACVVGDRVGELLVGDFVGVLLVGCDVGVAVGAVGAGEGATVGDLLGTGVGGLAIHLF